MSYRAWLSEIVRPAIAVQIGRYDSLSEFQAWLVYLWLVSRRRRLVMLEIPHQVGHSLRHRARAVRAAFVALLTMLVSSCVLAPLSLAAPVPGNVAPPGIIGIAQEGQRLTEVPGVWTGARKVAVQWKDCDGSGGGCAAIQGATGKSYMLTAGDVGHSIVVQETATNKRGSTSAASSPTATVSRAAASPPPASKTVLSAPAASLTNESVRIFAAVTATAGSPSGTMAFEAGTAPIAGCQSEPITPSTPVATCTTAFAASGSPVHLTAAFTANSSSTVASSAATAIVDIGQGSTSTSIDVSNTSVNVGSIATYTATVTPGDAGFAAPSGAVQFLDAGQPITACASQPLAMTIGGSIARCTVTYTAAGSHVVSARYLGDVNFQGSGPSPARLVTVHRLPVKVLGTINATMQWTFYYTPTFTKVRALLVTGAPAGATVVLTCTGRSCPYVKRAHTVRSPKPCTSSSPHICLAHHHGTVDLMGGFRNHPLKAGARIVVRIIRPHWIGKYYRFKIRAKHQPLIQIDCLAPSGTLPGVGC